MTTNAVEPIVLTREVVEQRVVGMCQTMAQIAEVPDDDTYSTVGQYLLEVKRLLRQIDDVFDPIIKAQHDAHKAALRGKQQVAGRLLEDERRLKVLLADYTERKLERQREAEVKAQLAALEDAKRRQEQQVTQLEAQGRTLEAEQVAQMPTVVPTVVLDKTPPKVAGIIPTTTWDFEVEDAALVPREYLCVDETRIRAVVRALCEQTRIPGVRVFPRKGITARTS